MDEHDILLEMQHISKSFGGVHALQDVSFRCRRGGVHALLGENGAGKSTLIKILAGVYQPDAGDIVFNGHPLTQLTPQQALAAGIRVIYQELALLPYMTVAENIFLGHEPRTRLGLTDTARMHAESRALLDQLGAAIDPATPVGELTVAGQQMVEIAKALSEQSTLIVMDEPSAILAGHELESLFATVRRLTAAGVTIIYISHRLNEIFEIADDVTVLKDGRVAGTALIGEVTRSQLIQMMVGRPLDEVFPASSGQRGAPVLRVEGVSARGVRDVSFVLHAGEIVGLAGMVGSGRTELARALFGADPVDSGTVTITPPAQDTVQPAATALSSASRRRHSPRRAIRAGLALVPEDRKTQGLFLEQSIRRNIALPVLRRLSRWGVIRGAEETAVVTHAQSALSIQMSSPEQMARLLSGGNQQKVVLAKWLETQPSVMLFDEPTRGIDVGAKFEIYQLMRELTMRGVAILMISSELPEILGMSDRILVMHEGTIAGELARAEASEEAIVALATTGDLHATAPQEAWKQP
jgi:ribose transport system ATP-binding protein